MKLENCSRKFIDKEFDKFLKENSAQHEYYRAKNISITHTKDLNELGPHAYIIEAFDWSDDSERDAYFWSNLHSEWHDKLINEEIKENKIINLI